MLGFSNGSPNGDWGIRAGKIGGWGVGGKVYITCYKFNNPSIAFTNINIVTQDTSYRVNNIRIAFPNNSIVARETTQDDACIWGGSTVSRGG